MIPPRYLTNQPEAVETRTLKDMRTNAPQHRNLEVHRPNKRWTLNFKNCNSTQTRRQRRGIATVELALVLPVMLILVLGTIEVCQRIFLRQSSLLVAYEGARLAARSITSSQEVKARCNEMLTQRRVTGGTVEIIPENLLALAPGELFTIRVTVPWASNSPTRFVLQDQGTVSVDVHMLRE